MNNHLPSAEAYVNIHRAVTGAKKAGAVVLGVTAGFAAGLATGPVSGVVVAELVTGLTLKEIDKHSGMVVVRRADLE